MSRSNLLVLLLFIFGRPALPVNIPDSCRMISISRDMPDTLRDIQILYNGRLWQNDIIDTIVSSKNCATESPEWILLPDKGIASSIYSNVREEQITFKYPLLVRALGSPFTVVLDIVTLPVQLYVLVNL